MSGGGRHRVVKDTCKQERKTQLQQVGSVRPSAERHSNGEADSGRSSVGVARAGAKQQAAGRGWPRATPRGPVRAAPPAGTPRGLPAQDPPAPSKEPAGPPLHGAPTQQLLWPLALAQRQPPKRLRAHGPRRGGQATSTGRKPSPSCGASSPEDTRTPSQPEGLAQADSRATALPTPQAHLRLMKRSKVAGAKWPPGDRWAQPLAP